MRSYAISGGAGVVVVVVELVVAEPITVVVEDPGPGTPLVPEIAVVLDEVPVVPPEPVWAVPVVLVVEELLAPVAPEVPDAPVASKVANVADGVLVDDPGELVELAEVVLVAFAPLDPPVACPSPVVPDVEPGTVPVGGELAFPVVPGSVVVGPVVVVVVVVGAVVVVVGGTGPGVQAVAVDAVAVDAVAVDAGAAPIVGGVPVLAQPLTAAQRRAPITVTPARRRRAGVISRGAVRLLGTRGRSTGAR